MLLHSLTREFHVFELRQVLTYPMPEHRGKSRSLVPRASQNQIFANGPPKTHPSSAQLTTESFAMPSRLLAVVHHIAKSVSRRIYWRKIFFVRSVARRLRRLISSR